MAEVFKCRLEGIGGFDKTVVVKRILQHRLADQEFVNMFLDEARIAVRLSHPNIVHVFEIDEVDGLPYIAMEYVPGPSLDLVGARARLKNRIHVGHCARIISNICHALHHAHNAKDPQGQPLELVHRDVSPHNIIVSTEGIPKLLDFGIAKTRDRLAETRAGTLKGKLGYMSPEQFQGSEIDFRSDIFSIGVCLYVVTVGEAPFHGSTDFEIIRASAKAEYLRPRQVIPSFPPALEEIIVTAMQRDPAQRFPNARAMAERLEAFVASGPHASNHDTMMEWLQQLFPEGLENTGRNELPLELAKTPSSGKVQRPSTGGGARASHPAMPVPSSAELAAYAASQRFDAPRPHRFLLWGSLAALLLLAGAGLTLYLAMSSKRASAVEATRTYLAGAEQLLRQKKIEPALKLIERAESTGASDPVLNIRLTQLRDQAETERMLIEARKALETGNPQLALARAQDAALRNPNDPEAARLLEEARKALAQAEAPAAPVATSEPAPHPAQVLFGKLEPSAQPVRVKRSGEVKNVQTTLARSDSNKLATSSETAPPPEPEPAPKLEPAPPAVQVALAAPPVPAPRELTSSPAKAEPPAPAKALYKPRLPRAARVRSMTDVLRAFQVIEAEAIRGGAPASVVHDVTHALATELGRRMSAADRTEIYPLAMYALILEEAGHGGSTVAIGEKLKAAHMSGALRSR